MKPGDGSRVAPVRIVLVHPCLRTGTVIAIGLIEVPFLRPYPKRCSFVVGKVQTCDSYFVRLVMPGVR